MRVILTRHAYLPSVTLGRITFAGTTLATLEEPWRPNPNGPGGARRGDGRESCIPDGEYILKPHHGTLFKDVYRVSNPDLGVFDMPDDLKSPNWGRCAVLIHTGNNVDDILGCILVGMDHSWYDGKDAVIRSREAMGKLRAALLKDDHVLTIRPTAGTLELAA